MVNKDRMTIEEQLPPDMELPGRSPSVWERLSHRDRKHMNSHAPEAYSDLKWRPACFNAQQSEYSRAAFECRMIGAVPPLPAAAIKVLSYADPGGAATMTELERLTLKMINNHDADEKAFHSMSRDQTNRGQHTTTREEWGDEE